MTRPNPPAWYLYPAIFKPLPGTGRWSVRLPDLEEEGEVEGETLEEAALCATNQILWKHMDILERRQQAAPRPSPYESIRAEEGEIVQLLVVDSPKKIGKKGSYAVSGYLVAAVMVFLLALGSSCSDGGGGGHASTIVTTIVSDLRALAAASLMYYGDSGDVQLSGNENHLALLLPIFGDASTRFTQPGDYAFRVTGDVWWVGYDLRLRYEKRPGVRERLAGRAQELGGLFGSPSIDVTPVSADAAHLYKADMDAVWMMARTTAPR
jgi:hypothetical protein